MTSGSASHLAAAAMPPIRRSRPRNKTRKVPPHRLDMARRIFGSSRGACKAYREIFTPKKRCGDLPRRANHGVFATICPVLRAKIYRLIFSENLKYGPRCPASMKRRIAIVTTREAGCDGRLGASDERDRGGRRRRVVLAPLGWRQACK